MAKTKDYDVYASVKMWVGGHVHVTAKNEKEAKKKAIKEMLTNRHYYVSDFDGNRMDFDEEQIEILGVEAE